MIFNYQIMKKVMIALTLFAPYCIGDYVPGIILARLKRGVVELPQGYTEGNIGSITGNQNLKSFLANSGLSKIERVFRNFNSCDTLQQLENGEIVRVQDLSLVFKFSFNQKADIQVIIESLLQYSEVLYADHDGYIYPHFNPNDDSFSEQWALKQGNDYDIDVELAWDIETGNSNIRIGIIDATGLCYKNADLGSYMGPGHKVRGGYDYRDGDYDPLPLLGDHHGTHIAGIVGALTHNNLGIAGVAGGTGNSDMGCVLYGFRIHGTWSSMAEAVVDAAGNTWGNQILNMSMGDTLLYDEVMREAVCYAYKMGRIFCASKGNDGERGNPLNYPSDFDHHWVISVGATNESDIKPDWSSYGHGVDVVAPGVNILSTCNVEHPGEELYLRDEGTSMAAPHVAGLSGLLLSKAYEKNVNLQPEDVEGIIRATAKDLDPPGYDDEYGAGRINIYDALRYFDMPNSTRRFTISQALNTYVGTFPLWLIGIPGLPDDQYRVDIYEVKSAWFSLPTDILQFLGIWGLGRYTTGYSFWFQQVPYYGEGWCTIEKSGSGQYRTKTYVYGVWSLDQQHWYGWFPRALENVTFRYSIFSVNVVAPFNLHPTNVTETSLILDWDYNYPDLIDGFTVKKDGVVIGNPGSGQTQWPVTGLEPGHMYHFEVLARKGSVYSAPAVLDAGTIPIGAFAQSGYSRMTAFNNGAKVARFGNNVYITYAVGDWGSREIHILRSTDGGVSFAEVYYTEHGYYRSQPSIAMDNSGAPYVVWGEIYYSGKGLPGWNRSYKCAYCHNNIWSFEEIYAKKIGEQLPWEPPEDSLGPPSLALSSDRGYVVFKPPEPQKVVVANFLLNNPAINTKEEINCSDSYETKYPSIGYDPMGRLVVAVQQPINDAYALYWRAVSGGPWTSVPVETSGYTYSTLGAPSIWAYDNGVKFTFNGCEYAGGNPTGRSGLMYVNFGWSGGNYVIQPPVELVSADVDFIDGSIGLWQLVSRDVVIWQYAADIAADIWYSRRMGGVWTPKTNISATAGNTSSYPQGIVYGSLTTVKLFALWTEQVGSQYYLVRKIINLPYAYPVYAVGNSDIPEATGYNNARRFLKDANGVLHLAFTSDGSVYHTLLQDTTWSEPVLIGIGKYPTLSLASDGKIYCTWSFHGLKKIGGLMYYVEYLYWSSFDALNPVQGWSQPGILFHTYGSFLWGVGAPSMAIYDTTAYITFKSYHGPQPHPVPGFPAPHIVVNDGPALIYGTVSLNNPVFAWTYADTIIKNWVTVDTLTYCDSMIPLLISPSVAVDKAGIPHILWEGDSTMMRYYTITGAGITKDTFDAGVDFPHLTMNGDKVDLFWTANDSIRYRYGWTGTTNLSQAQTIAECESPFSSSQYLTWTNSPNSVANDGNLSHLYYGAIPASGAVEPAELNYSTDQILFPQIVFNSAKNGSPSLDFVWTEYSEVDSLGYIYYLNLPLTEAAPKYAFDMGTETPVPVCLERDGFLTYGSEDYQTVDYDSTELVYQLTLHSPHVKYKICWTYYHQEPEKIKLGFSIDDILHHNRWVEPYEQVVEETWIPQACLDDNAILIRVTRLKGTIAVLSGMEIEEEEVGGGGGPQGNESQFVKPFLFETMYPNPANKVLKIRFNSPDDRKVAIKIYDVAGRLAQLVFEGNVKAGMNEYLIKPKNFAAGIYFVRVEAAGYKRTQKVILLQ